MKKAYLNIILLTLLTLTLQSSIYIISRYYYSINEYLSLFIYILTTILFIYFFNKAYKLLDNKISRKEENFVIVFIVFFSLLLNNYLINYGLSFMISLYMYIFYLVIRAK